MAADDWFEIEDYYTGRKTTMEDIAAIGPEGRLSLIHISEPTRP